MYKAVFRRQINAYRLEMLVNSMSMLAGKRFIKVGDVISEQEMSAIIEKQLHSWTVEILAPKDV